MSSPDRQTMCSPIRIGPTSVSILLTYRPRDIDGPMRACHKTRIASATQIQKHKRMDIDCKLFSHSSVTACYRRNDGSKNCVICPRPTTVSISVPARPWLVKSPGRLNQAQQSPSAFRQSCFRGKMSSSGSGPTLGLNAQSNTPAFLRRSALEAPSGHHLLAPCSEAARGRPEVREAPSEYPQQGLLGRPPRCSRGCRIVNL